VAIQAVEATSTTAPTVAVAKYKEAPMLADLVTSGKLPAVDKRLPDDPLVTTPVESIGKYGGTLHTAATDPGVGNVLMYFGTEAPIKWKADLTGYEAASVESYEWSSDGKTFTMHMRKGMKWSDGEPYTSADWKFFWEDYAKNPDQKLYSIPNWLRKLDGTPIDMEYPDAYTVVWKSDRAMWINPYNMAQGFWVYANAMMKPAHYLKQFHPKYTSTATWKDFADKDKWWLTPGYPCLMAWCLKELSADSSRYTFERNPYYWRVDTEGNQLPYIDNLEIEIVADEQVRILNCSQGKYDTAFRICGGPNDIAFLQEQGKANGFHLLTGWMNGAGGWPAWLVNQYYVEGGMNYPDDTPEHAKEIRDLLRDKRFRQALSIGFSRQRLIDVAWNGIGTPQQATISPQAWHFASTEGQQVLKEWQASYATEDDAKANAMLDEIGMKKGTDGFRTLPSGKAFTLIIDVTDWGGSLKVQTDAAAEVKNEWEKKLAIKIEVKNLQGQPDATTRLNNCWYMLKAIHVSEVDIWTYPDWIFPVHITTYWDALEGKYYDKGREACVPDPAIPYDCGVKPVEGSPAFILQALYDEGLNEPDIQKRHEIVWEAIKEIETDGPFVIGVSGDQPMPAFVKDYMRNIYNFGVLGPWAPATPGNGVPAQWWMDISQ
jgi:peptide/nickel transport system substrate-binding protein